MTLEIDLRSDTVTRPTQAMRRAMAACAVGDDVYGEDPTVNRLEQLAAEITGKEAALFVPSGTMGNLLALKVHTQPGDRVLVPATTHIYLGENGGGAAIAGVQFDVLPAPLGIPDLDTLRSAIAAADYHLPPVRLVTLENTHNLIGGVVLQQEQAAAYARLARAAGAAVHLDGARLFNAAIASGRPVSELASIADTVMFCISKGLAAPVGSLLCGSAPLVHRARWYRKMVGGGMRQAGILAAAGIVSLESMVERLAEDHQKARMFAEGLLQLAVGSVDPTPQTNIVNVRASALGLSAPALVEHLARANIRVASIDAHTVRFVFHLDVSTDDVQRALAACAGLATGAS